MSYTEDSVVNIQVGELIFGVPRDKQVLAVNTDGLEDGLIRLIFTDFREQVFSASTVVQVRLPRKREPIILLLDEDDTPHRYREHEKDKRVIDKKMESARFYGNRAPAHLLDGGLEQTDGYWEQFKKHKELMDG